MKSSSNDERPAAAPDGLAERIHFWVTVLFLTVMAAEFVALAVEGRRLPAFLVILIMIIIAAPLMLRNRLPVRIPAEFQLLAVIFVFSALFLGEIRDYYTRIWWWDIALHANSGLLLGIVGFLLVYVLNESENIELHLTPHFMALFAFLFAVAMGTVWEIFEFAMDQLFGMQMQKPMRDDPSGLTDTMWDLIMDTAGAFVMSVTGWWYVKHDRGSFIEAWIEKFIARNPRMFRG